MSAKSREEKQERELLLVGIGGTTRPSSATEHALRIGLKAAHGERIQTKLFGGAFLAKLPLYAPESQARNAEQRELVEAVRMADGLIVASPGYHGGVSGLVKNALDLLEDLREDERPYLEGRAVGCIVAASGWQAAGTTLAALRSIVHGLRGWPTPMGAMLNTLEQALEGGGAGNEKALAQIRTVGRQVAEFARKHGG